MCGSLIVRPCAAIHTDVKLLCVHCLMSLLTGTAILSNKLLFNRTDITNFLGNVINPLSPAF